MAVRDKAWRRLLTVEALGVQKGCCLYCKAPLNAKVATADHMWPKSRKGGDQKNNIAAACYSCNQAKGSMSHIEFFKLIKNKLPSGSPMKIILIWSARRIWKRTHRACARIERMVA